MGEPHERTYKDTLCTHKSCSWSHLNVALLYGLRPAHKGFHYIIHDLTWSCADNHSVFIHCNDGTGEVVKYIFRGDESVPGSSK
jgi:hypothetical protein